MHTHFLADADVVVVVTVAVIPSLPVPMIQAALAASSSQRHL